MTLITSGCGRKNAPNTDSPHLSIATQLRAGNLSGAEQQALKALAENPTDRELWLLSGDIAAKAQRWGTASDRYLRAAEVSSRGHQAEPLVRAAQVSARSQRLMTVIDLLTQAIEDDPRQPAPHVELTGILCALGMDWEATEHLRWSTMHGVPSVSELVILANRVPPQTDEAWIAQALKHVPNEKRPLLGRARLAASKDDWQQSKRILEEVLQQHPDFLPAWVLYGRSLFESDAAKELQAWLQKPHLKATSHPDYWLTLGLIEERDENLHQAIRSFYESLVRDPGHCEAAAHLAPLLLSLGHMELAEEVADHGHRLDTVIENVTSFLAWKRDSQAAAVRVAQSMHATGRDWEAVGWARAALQMRQDLDASARSEFQQCSARLKSDTPFIQTNYHPIRWKASIDAIAPTMNSSNGQNQYADSIQKRLPSGSGKNGVSTQLRFENEAKARGLDFRYHNGDDPHEQGLWIYQSYGGGVAAFDYDLNGYPDLYFGDAGCEPLDKKGPLSDQLFRNVEGRFRNNTAAAHATDDRFSQGVGVGDFDQDGFPDLAVANIGENRLYRNNGDGTFQDITVAAGLQGARWTSCICLVDLDGDHICDLLEVNYCENEGTYTVPCFGGKDGKRKQVCSPTAFGPEPDRFWKGTGDGRFVDATDQFLMTDHPGRGLGVLISNFDEEPGLEVFIANDMSANHFWKCGRDAWSEQASLRGLANDARGRAQACMGIAAGDPNRDGRLDLLVTNFEKESNAFYVQTRPGFFEDRAAREGLAEPSYPMLGFGTQFADFDGDNRCDALVTNGHVIDHASQEGAYAMPPQAFTYEAGWVEIPGKLIGSYFEQKYVGRAMALIDVQRDGWPDVLINHLFEPAALLINQSLRKQAPFVLELVAQTSSRDAVGTRVEIVGSEPKQVRWRNAGDGFQCANEPTLWFAVPEDRPFDIDIQWPSGHHERIEQLTPGHYLVVEGDRVAIPRKSLDSSKP